MREYLARYITEGELIEYVPEISNSDYKEAVKICAHKIVDFVYDYIERRRRRAMWEMLQAARDAKKFREQLIAYMEESEFTQPVKKIAQRKGRVNPSEWFGILDKARGVEGMVKLFGACRRQLEEFPEHPGLLLIAGFCRLYYGDEGLRDIRNAFLILKERFEYVDQLWLANEIIKRTRVRFAEKLDAVLNAILEGNSSIDIARLCYINATPYTTVYIRAFFILAEEALNFLKNRG